MNDGRQRLVLDEDSLERRDIAREIRHQPRNHVDAFGDVRMLEPVAMAFDLETVQSGVIIVRRQPRAGADIREPPSADDRDGRVLAVVNLQEKTPPLVREKHRLGIRVELRQGAVEIEEEEEVPACSGLSNRRRRPRYFI